MVGECQYWVVSPNVTGNNGEKYVEEWLKIIRDKKVAILGWGKNEKEHPKGKIMGERFAGVGDPSIQQGDIILIARRFRQ